MALLNGSASAPVGTAKYKVFVSTWNVGAAPPADDLNLEDWLDANTSSSDIYVLGFQEIVPLNTRNVIGPESGKLAAKWNSLIGATLNKRKAQQSAFVDSVVEHHKVYPLKDGSFLNSEFRCIISKQMVGILISVWARNDLADCISNLSVSCVGCGIMGCFKNKGSVSVRFLLHETSLCFVCCHLTSGDKEGDEMCRNSNVVDILSKTWFPSGSYQNNLPKKILDHDVLVLFGDLNYRISLPDAETRSLVEEKKWNLLLEKDQLRSELMEGRAFEGWNEGVINFPPTYKYQPNSDEYCWSIPCTKSQRRRRRSPAWCDRILWVGEGLKQSRYERCDESRLSDHRPVRATFAAEVNVRGLCAGGGGGGGLLSHDVLLRLKNGVLNNKIGNCFSLVNV